MRCIIHSHHLVIVGCHDPGAPLSCMEDLNGISDAIVIVCHPHTAHNWTLILISSPMKWLPEKTLHDLHWHECAAWVCPGDAMIAVTPMILCRDKTCLACNHHELGSVNIMIITHAHQI